MNELYIDLKNGKRWLYKVDVNLLEIHHSKITVWLINNTTVNRYKSEWRMEIRCLSKYSFLKATFDYRFN